MQDSSDQYPYSTYVYLIERLNEMQNLCVLRLTGLLPIERRHHQRRWQCCV